DAQPGLIELDEHVLAKLGGARTCFVEDEPGDAVVIAGKLPVPPSFARLPARGEGAALEIARSEHVPDLSHAYTVSISMAPPCPPPMHSVATPCLTPSRRIALTRCSTMRLPLAPTGWPSPSAPPSTLSLSRSMRPAALSRCSTSRQKVSSCQAPRQASTCAAK